MLGWGEGSIGYSKCTYRMEGVCGCHIMKDLAKRECI